MSVYYDKTTDLLPNRTLPTEDYTSSDNSNPKASMEETASQHYIIGDNLRVKAFYHDAIDELQRAVHIQEPLLGENSTVVAQTHYALGLCYRAIKEFKPAMYHLIKASSIYEQQSYVHNNGADGGDSSKPVTKVSAFNHPFKKEITDCKLNLARTHHSFGVALQRNGEYDKSIIEHRKALAIREHLLVKSHLETARSYYVIGCALSDRGDFDEALAELRRALRIRLLIFGRVHMDTKEVVSNLGVVLTARGGIIQEEINKYMVTVVQALELENEGDRFCRLRGDFANGMVCYRKALSLEEQALGDLHPTTCDLYLRTADTFGQMGDLESSLVEYKAAIAIYERVVGKFHVKVAGIYNKLAGILMDKGEYETALSFYAKAYGIYDSVLGNHDDTKQAIMNLRLAAAKERTAKDSMDLIKKAEEEFKMRQKLQREQEEELLKREVEIMDVAAKIKPKSDAASALSNPAEKPKPTEATDVI